MKSEGFLKTGNFTHIYYEARALDYPLARKILDVRKNARLIEVGHYKDVFCRPNQDFRLQKKRRKLILAVKRSNFIYKVPEVCQDFGNHNFYYSSAVMNCVYDCEYCFLQGMYPSANIVAFVNIGDFFDEILKQSKGFPMHIAVSYDTDLLAFENIIPFASMWIDFAARHRNIRIELRTKSANYGPISRIKPVDGVTLAWTLSPETVIRRYERHTPSLGERLSAAARALSDGWNVRLCFDPLIMVEDFEEIYGRFIERVFSTLPAQRIHDIGIGAFRMPSVYLKRIRRLRKDSELIYYPFEENNKIMSYPRDIENKLKNFVFEKSAVYMDKSRIFVK